MTVISRSFRGGLTATLVAAAVIASAGLSARAETRGSAAAFAAPSSDAAARAGAVRARVLHALPGVTNTLGVHFLYADDGTCPDGIDVFKVSGSTLTLVENIVAGCSSGGYFGAHRLAVTKKTSSGPACLFFASSGNGIRGTVNSFAIASSSGTLTPKRSVSGGIDPADLLVVGRILIETDPGGLAFNTYKIKTSCGLTALLSNSTGSERDINIAQLHGTDVASADFNTGNIVTYHLNTTIGAMTEVHSVAGQFGGPDSLAVQTASTSSGQVINVFTGHSMLPPARVQVAQATSTGSALSAFSGSPATDGDGSSSDPGIGVLVSGSLVLQLNEFSSQVAWYSFTTGTPGVPGSIAYGGDTALTARPTEMTQLGSTLFVAMWSFGVVDACAVGAGGVSGCVAVATLSTNGNPFGGEGAVAYL
jgi:hypothetical protein